MPGATDLSFLGRVSRLHKLSVSLLESIEISGYPEVAAALGALKGEVESAFDISLCGRYKIGRRSASGGRASRKHQASTRSCEQLARSAAYQKAMRKRAEQKAQIEWSAQFGRCISNVWLVRVMLADPRYTQRGLQELCTEFNVVEKHAISAATISKVRDAFVELIKLRWGQKVREVVKRSQTEEPMFVVHIHDGADMRMRSSVSETFASSVGVSLSSPTARTVTSRSRYSKIQNQYIDVVTSAERVPWFTELIAMAKKDAPTIATSLIQGLDDILAVIFAQSESTASSSGERRIVLHLITGDSIQTNFAAVRFVLAYFKLSSPWANRITYRVVFVKCGSHRGNMVCVTAVCGHPAKDPGGSEICANLVRLYKYLVPSYGDEFASCLRNHVVQHAVRVGGEIEPDASRADWHLRQLYGDVFPDSLCRLLNVHILSLQYRAPDTITDATRRGDIYAELYRLTFLSEKHPIITRFFLFTDCIHALLRIIMLDIPVNIFRTTTKTPGIENGVRLKKLVAFYSKPGTLPALKQAALCLRIGMIAVKLSSKKWTASSSPTDDVKEPTLVRLGKREVQQKTCEELCKIVGLLHADPSLDLSICVPALLLTELHVFIRFSEYDKFPCAGWRLSSKYNPVSHLQQIELFLDTEPSRLDVGFFLGLQIEAKSLDSYPDSLAYLSGEVVQSQINGFLEHTEASSLDVERKNNLDKKYPMVVRKPSETVGNR